MPDDATLTELVRTAGEHLSVLSRQAYEAGRKAGENAAKEKVLNLFGGQGSPVPPINTRQRSSFAEMATVSRPLSGAISMMSIGEDGVGPKEVLEFVNRQPDLQNLDIWQVRAGIKTLEKRGDLERVSRGKYRPTARLLGEDEDRKEETPNSGELFGAPKTNGAMPLSP